MRFSSGLRNSDSLVPHAQQDRVDVRSQQVDLDFLFFAGIFHGIFDEVENGGAQFLGISAQIDFFLGGARELQDLGRQVMAQPREFHRFRHDRGEIDFLPILLAARVARLAGLQNLLDRPQKPVRILEHDAIEILVLRLGELAGLQRFQVQANRGNRSFEFVRDRVEKAILLLVLVNFANQKNRVDHDSRDDQREENDAENQGNDFPPVEDNPGDVQRHRQSNQAGAQRHEKRDFLGTSGKCASQVSI